MTRAGHNGLQKRDFLTFVETQYATKRLDDAEFARVATAALGFNCTGAQVTYARGLFNIESTATVKANERVAARPQEQPAEKPGAGTAILEAIGRLETHIGDHIADVAGELDASLAQVAGRLTEQNALLLRSFESFKTDVLARFDALPKIPLMTAAEAAQPRSVPVVPLSIVPPAPAPRPVAVAAPPPAPRKMRVAIVGLLGDQKGMIEKEYDKCFNLRVYLSEDGRGKAFEDQIARCDAVVVMARFIGDSLEKVAKANGVRYVKVSGGMTSLRDKLTDLFVNEQVSA